MSIIQSVKDGNWSDPSTWDLKRIPRDGDTVELSHRIVCEPSMKPIKGAQVRFISGDAVLDTSKIKFSGVKTGSGFSQTQED